MLFNYKIQKPCIIYMCDARCTLSEILLWCHLFGLWENSDDKFVNKYGILFGNSLNNNFLSIPNSFHIPLKRGHPSYKPATFSLQKEWYYKRGATRRMLDTSAPGNFGTCVIHVGTKTNRHLKKTNRHLCFFLWFYVQSFQFQILIMSVPEKILIMPILILIHNL
jgi:hypothetical protein